MDTISKNLLSRPRLNRHRVVDLLLSALLLRILCSAFLASNAQPVRPTEYQVEAAYLFNFGKFVRWPERLSPSPGSPFVICVLGRDPFEGVLESTVSGQTIGGNTVSIRRVNAASEIGACRVLYVSADESRRYRNVLDAVRRQPILTVSDAPDFLRRGGIIQFLMVGDRVRFAINLDAGRDAGVQFSAELLKVASQVVGNPAEGKGLR